MTIYTCFIISSLQKSVLQMSDKHAPFLNKQNNYNFS